MFQANQNDRNRSNNNNKFHISNILIFAAIWWVVRCVGTRTNILKYKFFIGKLCISARSFRLEWKSLFASMEINYGQHLFSKGKSVHLSGLDCVEYIFRYYYVTHLHLWLKHVKFLGCVLILNWYLISN